MQEGLNSASKDVRHASAMALAVLLSDKMARGTARTHGIVARIAQLASDMARYPENKATQQMGGYKLHWAAATPAAVSKSASDGVAAAVATFDLDIAFGLLTLLHLMDRDGQSVDCMTPGVVHFLMRIIASGSSVATAAHGDAELHRIVSLDSETTPSAGGVGASAVVSNRSRVASRAASLSERLQQFYTTGPAAAMNSPSAATSAAPLASRAPSVSGGSLRGASSQTSAAASQSSSAFDFDDFDNGGGADFIRVDKGLPERSATTPSAENGVDSFYRPAGSLRIPRSYSASSTASAPVQPCDVALYLLHRVTGLCDDEEETGAAHTGGEPSLESIEPDSAMSASSSAAAIAASEATEKALAVHVAATRAALRAGADGSGIALLVAKAAEAALTIRPLLSQPSSPSFAATEDSSSLSPLESAVPPPYRRPFMTVLLLLRVFEDASFLNENLVRALVEASLRLPLTPPHAGKNAASSASVAPESRSFVSLLLCVSDWCLANLVASLPVARGGGPGGASGAPPRGKKGSNKSPDTTGAAEQPAHFTVELLQGCLRVLVNLTNHFPPGCEALVAGAPLSTKSVYSEAAPGSTANGWALSLVLRLIRMFESAALSPARAAAAAAARGPRQSESPSPPFAYDVLVLALGLLTNCVEHSATAREAIGSLVGGDVSAALAGCGEPSALAYLCMLFVQRYDSLQLHSVPVSHAPASSESSNAPAVHDSIDFDAENVVVGAYLALLIGCAMQQHRGNQAAVLASIGSRLPTRIVSSSGRASMPRHPSIEALLTVLRAFVALQSHAGVLTDDAAHHISAVEALLTQVDEDSRMTRFAGGGRGGAGGGDAAPGALERAHSSPARVPPRDALGSRLQSPARGSFGPAASARSSPGALVRSRTAPGPVVGGALSPSSSPVRSASSAAGARAGRVFSPGSPLRTAEVMGAPAAKVPRAALLQPNRAPVVAGRGYIRDEDEDAGPAASQPGAAAHSAGDVAAAGVRTPAGSNDGGMPRTGATPFWGWTMDSDSEGGSRVNTPSAAGAGAAGRKDK